MRILFFILIIIHGAIHLMGFFKAFQLAEIKQLSLSISRFMGAIRLVVALLFILAGFIYFFKINWWHWLALVAVAISTVLIVYYWRDAKFGTVLNVLVFLVALISLSSSIFNNKVAHEIDDLKQKAAAANLAVIDEQTIENLPYPVQNWLRNSELIGTEKVNLVWLKQVAKMKMKPEQEDWSHATAEQHFTVPEPAFVWKVNMQMAPFIEITGRDKFVDGKGQMLIKLFSLINIVNEKGKKMDEGTLQRFLGEIVWFPSAVTSPYIKWETIDSLSAKATLTYKGINGSGTFYFNENGDFIKFSCLRYKGNEADSKRYQWIIEVEEHAIKNGIKIPVKMKASWQLENKLWTWLELEVVDIRYNNHQ
ncbi:MAG: DUF3784 domain-containing protein [Bacteroidales bacterium]|nr:DUF3784 domain-containing protein [Bacteroidales bacterium]